MATTSTWARNCGDWAASQLVRAAAERPGTMSSSRARPVPASTGVRSMITVTNPSLWRVCDQRCSSTPMTRTPSSRSVSAATIIWVASMAMVLTVSHDSPSSRATARSSSGRSSVGAECSGHTAAWSTNPAAPAGRCCGRTLPEHPVVVQR